MNISNLPSETVITTADFAVCNAMVSGIETTIRIAWSDIIAALGLQTTAGSGAIKGIASASTASVATITSQNGSWTDTGVTVTYTPSSLSAKILIQAMISIAADHATTWWGLRFVRDSTAIGLGTVTGSQTAVTTSNGTPNSLYMTPNIMQFVDQPNTTSSTVYKVQATCFGSSPANVYINRAEDNSNNSYQSHGISSITVMEF